MTDLSDLDPWAAARGLPRPVTVMTAIYVVTRTSLPVHNDHIKGLGTDVPLKNIVGVASTLEMAQELATFNHSCWDEPLAWIAPHEGTHPLWGELCRSGEIVGLPGQWWTIERVPLDCPLEMTELP